MKRAKAMLQLDSKPIIQIAFECGITNVSHFSRVFKETFGISPSTYQQDWTHK